MPDRTPGLRERLRRALHAYDTDIDARAVETLLPVVHAWAATSDARVEDAERELEQLREMYVSACTRARQRAERVDAALSALTDRERDLVREAAVMGYVQGAMAASGGAPTPPIPPDAAVVAQVVAACQSMEDLYPNLGGVSMTDRTPTADLRERLTAALDGDPHYSTGEVVATVLRVLAEPTSGLRERLAEAVGLARNGPSSDGRGWYRTAGDRQECLAVADAVLPVVQEALIEASLNPDPDDYALAPDPDEGLLTELADAIREANGTPEALAAWQRHPQLVPAHVYAKAVLPLLVKLRRRADQSERARAEQAEAGGDLRAQLVEAVRRAPETDPPNELSLSIHPAMDGDYELISGPPADFADAVLPVIQAWAAAQNLTAPASSARVERPESAPGAEVPRLRVAEAEAYAAYLDQDVIKPERALHEQTIKRAEEAERRVERMRAMVTHEIRTGNGASAHTLRRFLAALDQPQETDPR